MHQVCEAGRRLKFGSTVNEPCDKEGVHCASLHQGEVFVCRTHEEDFARCPHGIIVGNDCPGGQGPRAPGGGCAGGRSLGNHFHRYAHGSGRVGTTADGRPITLTGITSVVPGNIQRLYEDADGRPIDIPTVILGSRVPEEIVVWSTWQQWVLDGVKFGFIDGALAQSLIRRSRDGDPMIVEAGVRMRESPVVQHGDGSRLVQREN